MGSLGTASLGSALPLVKMPDVDYGPDQDEMVRYRTEGTRKALAMDNRGPIRFDADGTLSQDILDAYWKHGFYVFEGVLKPDELDDLERDVVELLDRAPVTKGADLDRHGRPALGADSGSKHISWVRPLSDPLGGTGAANGRHPAKMSEPTPPEGAPDWVVQVISGSLQYSDACLRTYGHPGLMRVTEAVNGPDFTPFNEVVWIKAPRLGGSVAWHQDPWTHWDSPEMGPGTHGFNYMAQLYGCDAENGLWVVPGSHAAGKVDIKAIVDGIGSDRLPDAVPLICAPGDVAIANRQAIHGSFANTSGNPRVTINFGFHRRSSVLNVTSGGVHNPITTYTDEHIFERSKVIGYAINARAERFPDETPYDYAPFSARMDEFAWTDEARDSLKGYNNGDLGI